MAGTPGRSPEVFDSGPIRNQNLTLLSDGTLLVAMPSGDLVTREVYEELMANTPPGVDDVREYPGRERAIAPDQDTCYLAERGPYVRRSTDRGRTWSQRYYVESVPGWDPVMPGFSAPFGLRARVIELSDGVLVFPIHSMGLPSDADPDDSANITFVPVLVASEDGGMNWDFRGNIAPPQLETHFNETEVIETPSGKNRRLPEADIRRQRGHAHLHRNVQRRRQDVVPRQRRSEFGVTRPARSRCPAAGRC